MYNSESEFLVSTEAKTAASESVETNGISHTDD